MKRKANKIVVLGLILLIFTIPLSFGQQYEHVSWNDPRPIDSAYYAFRNKISTPTCGLKKVQALISQRSANIPDEMLIDYDGGISTTDFDKLTIEEKFTYVMIYPEIYSQACAERMYAFEPQNKIFGHLLFVYNGVFWSKRQLGFMKKNKGRIIDLIIDQSNQSHELGLNYKAALVEMSAWESIPFLIDFYHMNPQDKDILTTLLLFLNKAALSTFKQSKIHDKLYGPDTNYESWINFSKANEQYILESAQTYYAKRKGL